MFQMVEDNEGVGEHQCHVRQPEWVGIYLPKRLDRAHEVVPEEADGAAREWRPGCAAQVEVGLVEAAGRLRGGRVGVAAVGQ